MISSAIYDEASRDKLLTLLATFAYRQGSFTLSSGQNSNHYVNCKPVTLSGVGLAALSTAILERIELQVVAVAGLTLGADPLVSGVAMRAAQENRALDALIVRKEPKGHGTGAWIEGPLPPIGSQITVLEDVITTGNSSIKAVEHLREAGYHVRRVITIVDREEGGEASLKQNQLELVSLFKLDQVSSRAQALM